MKANISAKSLIPKQFWSNTTHLLLEINFFSKFTSPKSTLKFCVWGSIFVKNLLHTWNWNSILFCPIQKSILKWRPIFQPKSWFRNSFGWILLWGNFPKLHLISEYILLCICEKWEMGHYSCRCIFQISSLTITHFKEYQWQSNEEMLVE